MIFISNKNKRRLAFIALTAIIALMAAGCSNTIGNPALQTNAAPEKSPYPVSIQDETFDSAPQTCASLSPAITEIMFDMGYGDKITGRSDYDEYPEQILSLPSVGSPANPDINAIKMLSPELLITQSPIAATDVIALEASGTRVLYIPVPSTYTELCEVYYKLAMIVSGKIEAPDVISSALTSLDSAMTEASKAEINERFVCVLSEDMLTAGRDTLISDMLTVFGQNIASAGFDTPIEEITSAAPTVIFIAKGIDPENLPDEFKETDAFKSGKIIEIDYSLFERPTARLETVIRELTEKLSADPQQ